MQPLEFRRLTPEDRVGLGHFFLEMERSGIGRYFHPHPFTAAEAERICRYGGLDLYYGAVADRLLGYGMLRGWDAGFAIPTLGIAIHPSVQGQGLGRAFAAFLHAAARQRGAVEIKLKVYPDNVAAVTLYRSLGYAFDDRTDGQLVGVLKFA